MKLERRIIQIGNFPPVTHYGTEAAYNATYKRLVAEYKVKLNAAEKSFCRGIRKTKYVFTDEMLEIAYAAYKEAKRRGCGRIAILDAVRQACKLGPGKEGPVKAIYEVRKRFGNGKSRAIKYWDVR